MSFQKCPICNGLGKTWFDLSESECRACNGHGLINSNTGEAIKPKTVKKSQYEQLYKQFENTRSGNTFDSWLKEEGIYDEVEERVNERNKSKKV